MTGGGCSHTRSAYTSSLRLRLKFVFIPSHLLFLHWACIVSWSKNSSAWRILTASWCKGIGTLSGQFCSTHSSSVLVFLGCYNKYRRPGGLRNRNILSYSSRGWKFEIKVSSKVSLLGLRTATFCLVFPRDLPLVLVVTGHPAVTKPQLVRISVHEAVCELNWWRQKWDWVTKL